MAGRVRLIGPEDGVEAKVHTPTDAGHTKFPGLVVYNHNIETGIPLLEFFADETGSVDQNINASGAGTLTPVHDGGDTTLWNAVAVSGTWDFASTTQSNTGTSSIELGTRNGDTASFTWPAAGDLSVGVYDAFRGFIYITSWPNSGNKEITIQLYLNGAPIGQAVQLSNYIDTSVQDSWQLFSIPMSDFQTTSAAFDAVWVSMVDAGAGAAPSGFLDDLAFVQSGTGATKTFTIAPPADQVWVVNRIKWTAVANSSSIKYNEFFGLTGLTNGYQFAFKSRGRVIQTFVARDFYDMLQYPNVTAEIISGTASIFELYYDIPQELQTLIGSQEQSIELTVRDDLSSMVKFKATMQGYIRRTI
jgi:hypothetical protein